MKDQRETSVATNEQASHSGNSVRPRHSTNAYEDLRRCTIVITANSPNIHLFLITQSSPACDDGECLWCSRQKQSTLHAVERHPKVGEATSATPPGRRELRCAFCGGMKMTTPRLGRRSASQLTMYCYFAFKISGSRCRSSGEMGECHPGADVFMRFRF